MVSDEPLVAALDRPPEDDLERSAVNGFSQVETIDEIWVRYLRPPPPDGMTAVVWAAMQSYCVCRIYLGFRILEPNGRHMADRIQEEFEMRMHHTPWDFEVVHVPTGKVPDGTPSRIWKRPPRVWTPTEHASANKRGQ